MFVLIKVGENFVTHYGLQGRLPLFIRNHNVHRVNQNSNGSHDFLKYNNSN